MSLERKSLLYRDRSPRSKPQVGPGSDHEEGEEREVLPGGQTPRPDQQVEIGKRWPHLRTEQPEGESSANAFAAKGDLI